MSWKPNIVSYETKPSSYHAGSSDIIPIISKVNPHKIQTLEIYGGPEIYAVASQDGKRIKIQGRKQTLPSSLSISDEKVCAVFSDTWKEFWSSEEPVQDVYSEIYKFRKVSTVDLLRIFSESETVMWQKAEKQVHLLNSCILGLLYHMGSWLYRNVPDFLKRADPRWIIAEGLLKARFNGISFVGKTAKLTALNHLANTYLDQVRDAFIEEYINGSKVKTH